MLNWRMRFGSEIYNGLTKHFKCQFKAITCEAFGGLSESAIDLLNDVIHAAPDFCNYSQKSHGQLRNELCNSIAIAFVMATINATNN